MTEQDFYVEVTAHPDLEFTFLDGFGDDARVVVRCLTGKLLTSLKPETVLAEEWPRLLEIMTGRVKAVVLGHMTRIVGYYSMTDNWNLSKLGELADRRKAAEHYAIPETCLSG